ncbi:MAG: Crp/Fnr family transcriptional regulator [Thermoanaerobacteraceae bacterium]|nr:Crp/Fnr family transcriptional regulator [Thermoanaerobacteraceae bacterium]
MSDIDLIRKIPIFSGLNLEELNQVSNIYISRKYKKGQIIFFEGEPGEAVYFVKEGKIKVYKSDAEGREYILHIFGPGNIFAETVLLGGDPYPANAEAVEDSVVGVIKNSDLEELLKKNTDIAFKIMKILSNRLRESQEKLKNFVFRDTFDRTACALHKMSLEHGTKTPRGIEVELPITRTELASIVGTSRETVTRMLSEMRRKGIIDMDKQKIIVKNERELMICVRD